jgi:hypothetical protein
MTDEEIPRILNQREAARMLRVSDRRLREYAAAPWWRPELRTAQGYDIAEIVRAQTAYMHEHFSGTLSTEQARQLKARQLQARVAREEAEQELAELKAAEQRLKSEKLHGNILPADIYAEFCRELLGMIRAGLEDLPYRLSREASPAVRSFVYVPPEKIRSDKDIAPVQREIQKLISAIEGWLKEDPENGTG